jgi:hypothetical protein
MTYIKVYGHKDTQFCSQQDRSFLSQHLSRDIEPAQIKGMIRAGSFFLRSQQYPETDHKGAQVVAKTGSQ